jgi:hypothetical protein
MSVNMSTGLAGIHEHTCHWRCKEHVTTPNCARAQHHQHDDPHLLCTYFLFRSHAQNYVCIGREGCSSPRCACRGCRNMSETAWYAQGCVWGFRTSGFQDAVKLGCTTWRRSFLCITCLMCFCQFNGPVIQGTCLCTYLPGTTQLTTCSAEHLAHESCMFKQANPLNQCSLEVSRLCRSAELKRHTGLARTLTEPREIGFCVKACFVSFVASPASGR